MGIAYKNLFEKSFHLAHKLNGCGTCLEFGVGWGNTLRYQLSYIKDKYVDSRIIGFDSFMGLPQESEGVWYPDRHSKGCFANPKPNIDDERVSFVEGFYEKSLTPELRDTISNVIFVNIDVDLYISSVQVLKFIEPLLKTGTIIYWDDWKDPIDKHPEPWGEHKAYEEWSKTTSKKCEILEINEYNQHMMKVIGD
jgi:hypothetical protein